MRLIKIMLLSSSLILWGEIQAQCLPFKPVFKLISQRASLLKDVAANKYKSKQSVFDATQELKVLQRINASSSNLGLESYSLIQYAQLQMDLAKQIEQYWLDLWQSNPQLAPKAGQYQDLVSLRAQIQSLDQQIYPHLASAIKLNYCSITAVEEEFMDSFSLIKGIPTEPDFSKLMVNAILAIKLKHKSSYTDFLGLPYFVH